jgi:hypothetical protein
MTTRRKDIVSQAARVCNVSPRRIIYLACVYNDNDDFEKYFSDYSMKRKLPYFVRSYALAMLKARE